MAKSISNSIKGIIVLSVLAILTGCGKPKDLKYGAISDVSVKNLSLTGVDVEASIPIENPNGYDIMVQEAALDLSTNNNVLAHILQTGPVTIQGKSKTSYRFGASIKLANAGALMSLMSLMNGNRAVVNVDGTIKAKSFVFTKTINVHETNIQDYLKPVLDKMKLF